MTEAVGWDLDSSVCRTVHRRHMVPEIRAGRATWDDYAMACLDDEPVEGAVALMQLMTGAAPEVQHIAISGRSERALDLTRAWAARHDVPFSRYMLRPDGDHTPNGQWKVRCLRRLAAGGTRVRLFVEDWDKTAAYIREKTGIPVLGLNPFDPGSALVTREQLAAELEKELGPPGAGKALAESVFPRLGGSW